MNSLATKRNIALCIIFTIITGGIYGIYWIVRLNAEICELSNQERTNGAVLILLDFITCGIYGIYWNYKMGQNVNRITGGDNNHVVYLLLSLFELTFVSLCLMQNEVNKCVDNQPNLV